MGIKANRRASQPAGFTIVELLIVIVVIGILVAIVVIAFNGVQRRAVTTMIQSDLRHAAQLMKAAQADSDTDIYPSAIPAAMKTSHGVSLSMVGSGSGGATYSNLSAVQNGLLFYVVCQELLGEGVGKKLDDNHDYVSACTVSNKGQIHINGWNGRDVKVPVTTTSLQQYVSSYTGGQKDLFTTHGGNFMNQLTSRFLAAGGVYPVTSFWDSWATASNGGVMQPTLPAPTQTSTSTGATTFCINATHDRDPTLRWYVTQDQGPTAGQCPQ